ncbi:hypothetical protein Salat_2149500 [Sesamum alatum]|uniref:Uncharacterized protein n=1 Tax=Sesamum alatum TaxID=300844 RepID=A0AAE1Y1G4_9LAMI|nr:hypothetical protein Salat_2149500 [Sesamum alatum]
MPKVVSMVRQSGILVSMSWLGKLAGMSGRVGQVGVDRVGRWLGLLAWCETVVCAGKLAAHVRRTWLDAAHKAGLMCGSLADGWQARARGNDSCALCSTVVGDNYARRADSESGCDKGKANKMMREATHNFVAAREVQKMGLTLAERCSRTKVVNSEAKPIQGIAIVDLRVGANKGNVI